MTDAAPLTVSRPTGTLTHDPEPVNTPQQSRNGPVMVFTRPLSVPDSVPKSGLRGNSEASRGIALRSLLASAAELRAQAGVQGQARERLGHRGFVERVNE